MKYKEDFNAQVDKKDVFGTTVDKLRLHGKILQKDLDLIGFEEPVNTAVWKGNTH